MEKPLPKILFHISPAKTEVIDFFHNKENLKQAVKSLDKAEIEMYRWLRESFSLPWVAETLFIKRSLARRLAARLYKKLRVRNQMELVHLYGTLDKPTEQAAENQKIPVLDELCEPPELFKEDYKGR